MSLIDEYLETRIGPNPLNWYMKDYKKRLENHVLGVTRFRCSYCGGEGAGGVSDGFVGRFKCFNCFYNEELERVSNDPTMIKRVRVWNLRAAREKKKIEEEYKNNLLHPPIVVEEQLKQNYLTESEKEEICRKLMATLDLP